MTTVTFRFDKPHGHSPLEIDWEKGEAWWEGVSFLSLVITEVCRKVASETKGCPVIALRWIGVENAVDIPDEVWAKAREEWNRRLHFIADNIYAEKDDPEKEERLREDARLMLAEIMGTLWD